MTRYLFKGILQRTGWQENTAISVDDQGVIKSIESFDPSQEKSEILGYALPGFQNAHSHAFQYAMAGLAERHDQGSNPDDFWGWREAMYQLALSVSPEQMEVIATMLYTEMLSHGYTNVAEFHYVHHDKNGSAYSNLAEMGSRLIAAAKTAGIGITLVPIFYQKGGFGEDPNPRQKRFISETSDDYLKLLEASTMACSEYENANIGVGIHSLRAVQGSDIVEIAGSGPQDIPFHIHVSEQLKEIEDALAYLGKRPVEWLAYNVDLNERFHLVHATHLLDNETMAIAKSGANVVLCPSTEGNLGDGLFPLRKFQDNGGSWSIGTDSHVGLNPLEELRILDYGQRLTTHKRNTFHSDTEGDSGTYAINMITNAGRKAMGNSSGVYFEPGQLLNAAIVNDASPLLANTSKENLTSTIVYTLDRTEIRSTISHGRLIVQNGRHKNYDTIAGNFGKVVSELKNR